MKGPWSTTYGQYTTDYAWCVIDATVVHLQCLTPSTTMASMTVANLGRAFPLSRFHLISLQECTTASAKNPHKEVKMEWSTLAPLGAGPVEKASLANLPSPSLTLP